MTVTDARYASTRNTLDSPHIRADVLPLSHGHRSRSAEVMRRRRPVNSPSTRTESMTSTGIATVMAKNATTADQTNGSPNGQLVAALVTNRPANCSPTEAVLLRAEAIPHFSRSQSEALNDFGNKGRGSACLSRDKEETIGSSDGSSNGRPKCKGSIHTVHIL